MEHFFKEYRQKADIRCEMSRITCTIYVNTINTSFKPLVKKYTLTPHMWNKEQPSVYL